MRTTGPILALFVLLSACQEQARQGSQEGAEPEMHCECQRPQASLDVHSEQSLNA